jgi:uncharacterized protein (TIGR03382 family)
MRTRFGALVLLLASIVASPKIARASDCSPCWAELCVADEPAALAVLHFESGNTFVVDQLWGETVVAVGDRLEWMDGYGRDAGKQFIVPISPTEPEMLATPLALGDDAPYFCGERPAELAEIVQAADCREAGREKFGLAECDAGGCASSGPGTIGLAAFLAALAIRWRRAPARRRGNAG